jgi:hypothetical protein
MKNSPISHGAERRNAACRIIKRDLSIAGS